MLAAVADLARTDESDPGTPRAVEFFLPAWTPGSYLIREYAKHLGDFRPVDTGSDSALRWRKSAKNRFRIELPEACEQLRITYTLYAHELSVRTSDLTDRHAFLSGASVFLWPVGIGNDADVTVQVRVPDSWDVQTSLVGASGATGEFELRAGGLDELIDSPILAGEFEILSFDALGKPHHFILDGLEGLAPRASLVDDTIAIIEHAAAIFGGSVPYEEYKFLCMFADAGRGGLEHLTSSALLAPRTTFGPAKEYRDFMGLIAHEFFHVWNIKRMRPVELWEFDYENENYTELLWVAEGFTAYFDDHLCRRSGVLSVSQYLEIVASGITELHRTPGRHRQSLCEASFDAWIRLYRPDEDTRNSTLSYYGNGALAAMCLDLRIRDETDGERSLDDVVSLLYRETYEQGRGYTFDDVEQTLRSVSGVDLGDLLESLVRKPLDPDFGKALAPFGVELREKCTTPSAYLGVHFKAGTTTLSSLLEDGPADLAGLMPQDELLALEDLRVTSDTWSKVFDETAEADRPLEVLLCRRGRILTADVIPTNRPEGSLTLVVADDSTERQDRLRRGWLFDSTSDA